MYKKLLLSGSIAMLLLGIGTVVYADTKLQEIKAYLSPNIMLKGEDGVMSSIGAITYNKSVYVPIRKLGERLNVQIGWDSVSQTVEWKPNKWLSFDKEETAFMKANGYMLEAPNWLDLRYDVLLKDDIKQSIKQGSLEQGVESAVIIQYMIEDENLHRLHEVIARIEVFKEQNADLIPKEAEILAERGGWIYVVKRVPSNLFDPGTKDYYNYEEAAFHLKLHGYYLKLM